jgi:hypothetical protein
MTAPSTAARLASQAARRDAAMTAAITQLATALSALSTDEARAALEAAVPVPVRGAARFLEELAGHMATHPHALTSGDTHCPPVLLRLTQVLHDAGHPVVRPGCAQCGKVTVDLRQLRHEGRICGTCDGRSRRSTCSRCGQQDVRMAARKPEGKICYRCYHQDPETFKECSGCGRLARPVSRLEDGRVLCIRCWKRPAHTCVSCGKTAIAALVGNDGAYCHLCYNRSQRPRRLCGRCGRLGRIARNAHGDQPDLCDSCYRGPEMTCVRCGRVRPCQRVSSGAPICHTCYARDERPSVTCSRCRRDLPVMTWWPIGPVCQSCYTAILRSPAECARCRTCQPLIARDDDGAGICGRCAGHDADYTCRQCGRSGNPYGHGRCAYCVLADRVADLLTGPDGTVSPQLQPLAEAFAQVHQPFTAIQWIRESPNARLLAGLVADGRPLSHDLLDELPPTSGLHYIRQVMVQTGVLPGRHEDLERVPSWLEHHLVGKPAAHANLVRPFLHWFLLRRARSRAAARRYPASAGRDLRRRVLVALELLAWLDEQKIRLEELRQDDIDRWLDGEDTQRRNRIRYFLAWTAGRGLTGKLTVPLIPRQQPADLLGDDERWQLLHRCLTDEALPADVRAAGALILLFGLQAQRIRHLTADHLMQQDDSTYLSVGKHPILLPPRLGALLRQLAAQPPARLMISHGPRAPRWLFPGRVPGQPIDNHSLTNRLNRHGISARPARNGALAALATDLPAAILADLLGLHVNTAVRWVTHARRDWTDYLAARVADTGNPCRDE